MLEEKENQLIDSGVGKKQRIDWTLFVLIPVGVIFGVIGLLNIITIGNITSGVIFYLFMSICYIIISNALLHHKKVNRILHLFATVLAFVMIILWIYLVFQLSAGKI